MRASPRLILLPLSLALGLQVPSHGQVLPDAGSIRQQIEQTQRERPLPQAAPRPSVSPPPAMGPQAGATVTVQAFRFVGNRLLSAEQLNAAVSEFVGRTLDFAGLQGACDAAAAAYRNAGWVVRVYLPEQDISAGTVTLQVVEARYAGLRLEGQASQRVSPAEIQAWFQARQANGAPLNVDALDRALLLANDLPGVSVSGTLAPGASDGETALVVQTTDEPLIYGNVGLDNTGARATGSKRVSANLHINSPGKRGELVSLNLLHSQGSDYGRVALTVPDGYNGLRLGAHLSSMSYQVIDGPGAHGAAPIKGRSGSMGLDLSYPLVRARMHNLYLSAALDHKTFFTEDTQPRSDYASDSLRVGLSGNRFDEFGGGGANSASLQITQGRLNDMRAHALLGHIDPQYSKLGYSVSRQQSLTTRHSLLLSLSGQHASQVLDSSEKFYIGGAQTVRAYPASELGGERGQVASAEWRWRLDPAWVLSAFVDMGRVASLPPTRSDQGARMTLQGHGLGASWQSPTGLLTQLTWSRRSASHPLPTLTGTDGDGTLKLNRFWFTASLPF